MKKTFLMSLLLAAAAFTGCNKEATSDSGCPTAREPHPAQSIAAGGCVPPNDGPCPASCEQAICTMEFASVDLQVNDAANAPVTLDSFIVTDAANNIVQMPYGIAPGGCMSPGVYRIVNDAWVQGHQNTSYVMRAKGYKAGSLVVDAFVTIATDCCHVSLAAGPETVVIPN